MKLEYQVFCYYRTLKKGSTRQDPEFFERSWIVIDDIKSKSDAENFKNNLQKQHGYGLENPNSPGRKYYVEEVYR